MCQKSKWVKNNNNNNPISLTGKKENGRELCVLERKMNDVKMIPVLISAAGMIVAGVAGTLSEI